MKKYKSLLEAYKKIKFKESKTLSADIDKLLYEYNIQKTKKVRK